MEAAKRSMAIQLTCLRDSSLSDFLPLVNRSISVMISFKSPQLHSFLSSLYSRLRSRFTLSECLQLSEDELIPIFRFLLHWSCIDSANPSFKSYVNLITKRSVRCSSRS